MLLAFHIALKRAMLRDNFQMMNRFHKMGKFGLSFQ
jgi:hypothetical protein